jgi:hypothetical protein
MGLKYMKVFLISYIPISNFEYRKLITKLRISEHNLSIEKGRHLNIPREQRLYSHCKCIDDKKHFLLHILAK